eukprot:6201655-Pleurochrysis_carterae.AAC.1
MQWRYRSCCVQYRRSSESRDVVAEAPSAFSLRLGRGEKRAQHALLVSVGPFAIGDSFYAQHRFAESMCLRRWRSSRTRLNAPTARPSPIWTTRWSFTCNLAGLTGCRRVLRSHVPAASPAPHISCASVDFCLPENAGPLFICLVKHARFGDFAVVRPHPVWRFCF